MARHSMLLAALIASATALNGIVVPNNLAAETYFQAGFQDAGTDTYRVFLAASAVGDIGPMCWLDNSTTLNSTLSLTIPAAVGSNALYYSIGIADLTTSQGATYSNKFALTNANGTPTEYEEHLNGAPFWDANNLPCSSMFCARQCANQSYPADLSPGPAMDTMRTCIFACPGVLDQNKPSPSVSGDALATTSSKSHPIIVTSSIVATVTAATGTMTASEALTDTATATAAETTTGPTAASTSAAATTSYSNSEGAATRWAGPLLLVVGMAGLTGSLLE